VKINHYIRAASLDEAYRLINESPDNKIIAGCTFLKMTALQIENGVDLIDLNLSYIKDTPGNLNIGAMTSLRAIETSEAARSAFGDILPEAVRHIIGVQLRNHITVGAHVYSKFGFSEILPALHVLDASVTLHKGGTIKLEDFLSAQVKNDILTEISIPKRKQTAVLRAMRNSYSDYAILCTALSKAGDGWRIAVGARPGRSALAKETMAYLNEAESIDPSHAADIAAGEFDFGSNKRGSAAYRRELCRNFIKKEVEAIINEG
jgi:CO/xanthine dehydrogenase FAD-binding subunit